MRGILSLADSFCPLATAADFAVDPNAALEDLWLDGPF
jgi:hypothetical protein